MFDYAQWLKRAEAFVRGLDYLPGRWQIVVDVAPPLSAFEANTLFKSLPIELPPPLYKLYTGGAATFECRFSWSPDETALPMVSEVFPHQYSFYGGAKFVPANEFGAKGWARDFVLQESDIPLPGGHLWNECVPFVAIGNGDYLGLHIHRPDGQFPVLYLCHDAEAGESSSAFEIAPSLEQFLIDWEKLCYIGPEIWLLGHFLNEDGTGPLQADSPKAALWRDIMSGRRTA